MLSAEDNETITRTGSGTPVGAIFRRFWLPALLPSELPLPDSDPVHIRLLGEDLIGFRDTNGKVGIVQNNCPHRGASLFFGRNEEAGIRCVYHGYAKRDLPDQETYWRITQVFLPSYSMIPADPNGKASLVAAVPIDDVTRFSWKWTWDPRQAWTAEQIAGHGRWFRVRDELRGGVLLNQRFTDGVNDIMLGRRPVSDFDQLVKDWQNSGGNQIRTELQRGLSA